MKLKHSLLIFLLVVSLVSFYSCRNKVDEPSPTGPSTFSILMIASASPNVLVARDNGQRDTCDITVTLTTFQGTPLSNETIILDVYSDMLGAMENYGYFEGNESVVVRTTDGEGKVKVKYYGPTFEELIYSHPDTDLYTKDPLNLPPQQVHIRASLAWQGKELIEEFAQLQVVVEDDKNFRILADPNVLWIVEGYIKSRQSTVTATLTSLGGAPVKGYKVWFDITYGPGEFKQNGRMRISAKTDENGEAIVIYLSPKRDEISDNTKVTIEAQVETADPRWAHDETTIRLNQGN